MFCMCKSYCDPLATEVTSNVFTNTSHLKCTTQIQEHVLQFAWLSINTEKPQSTDLYRNKGESEMLMSDVWGGKHIVSDMLK
jgi:hypothetical protein